jgi:hypothetical protein
VQVSYDEGVAIHIGPESCAVVRWCYGFMGEQVTWRRSLLYVRFCLP